MSVTGKRLRGGCAFSEARRGGPHRLPWEDQILETGQRVPRRHCGKEFFDFAREMGALTGKSTQKKVGGKKRYSIAGVTKKYMT